MAATVAAKGGCAIDGSTLHAWVQRIGDQAEEQVQERLEALPQEMEPRRKASELAL